MGTVWMNMRGPELAACGVSSKDETIPVMTPPTIVAIVAVALSTLLSVRALYQSNVANKLTKKSSESLIKHGGTQQTPAFGWTSGRTMSTRCC